MDSFLLALVAFSGSVAAQSAPVRDNGAECSCFLVSGAEPGYFQNHVFVDFRNISPGAGEDFTKAPALLTESDTQGNEPVTSPYFNSTAFTNTWYTLTGQAARSKGSSVNSIDSNQNIFVFQDNDLNLTYLALRAQRLDSFVSNAEIDTNVNNILYSSMRTRTRLVPSITNSTAPQPFVDLNTTSIDGLNESHPVAPGAVYGFFTYLNDTEESDIEILTSDPITNIRYSNQPDYDAATDSAVPGASTDDTIYGTFDWSQWHDLRIDWFSNASRWYVDDQFVLEKTVNVPNAPSQLILNLWSDGGSWSQNMSVGAQVVAAHQWVEMVYNISGGNSGSSQCSTGCNVDGVKTQGTPEKAFSNLAGRTTTSCVHMVIVGGLLVWLVG